MIEISKEELNAIMQMLSKTSEAGRIKDFGLTEHHSELLHKMYDREIAIEFDRSFVRQTGYTVR